MSFLMHIVLFLCAINIKYSVGVQNKLGCRDHKNKIVDWYVLYKIPKLSHSSNPLIRTGSAYMYISNNTVDKGWELSTKDIGDKSSMPGNTLASLYNDKIANNLLWILYNDDPPNSSVVGKYGHAKGVVATDKNQGFWMIHSVPNFPPMPNLGTSSKRRIRTTTLAVDDFSSNSEYSYPSSGYVRGQSFLCISLKANQFNTVGRQLMYNQIIVYRKNLPAKLSNQYPDLTNAANQIRFKNPPYSNKEIIKSSTSLEFISFAKSDKWQKDLYSDFVAPQLKSSLFVETYLNGPGKLNSKCQGLEVHNIKSVKLHTGDVQFTSSQDHSKWVVAIDNKNNKSWVCVGDINRADTQYYRGGGTVCLNLFHLWKNYRDSVNDVEPCPLH
ncbi:hypothetical protein M0804_008072 [Polistes exclamans]|nr:hypothetical protein M0804_008072 [Polistes exclamans]